MEKNLVEKFKKLLDRSYTNYYVQYCKIKEMLELKEEFRSIFRSIVRVEDFYSLSSDNILRYMKYFDMDVTLKQIDTYKFILTEKMLSKSSKAEEPKRVFDTLAKKITREIMNGARRSELNLFDKKITLLKKYMDYVNGNNIFINDERFDLDELFEIFDYSCINELTDDEKKIIIDMFIKSDLDMLKKINERVENEELEKAQELFDRSGNEVIINLSEEVLVDESKDLDNEADVVVSEVDDTSLSDYESDSAGLSDDENNSSIVYFDDEINILSNPSAKYNKDVLDPGIIQSLNNNIEACKMISNQYNPREEYHYDMVLNLVNERDVVKKLEEYATGNDALLIYLLSVYACFLLKTLDKDLNDVYVEDKQLLYDLIKKELNDINFVLKRIDLLKKRIELVKSVQVDETDDNNKKYSLIFVKNGEKSYFSKSIEDLDKEEYRTVDKILGDLENGIVKGDKTINGFKSRLKNNNFVLYKMYGKYIFVMAVASISDSNRLKLSDRMKNWSIEREKRIVTSGGEELEQLLQESSAERNLVKPDEELKL